MRRLPPRVALAAAAALAALLSACGEGASGSRAASGGAGPRPGQAPPSLILVSIDTLRADHLGLYGYGRDTSPYLDRLAEECLVFDRAYTTAPWTLVAHMSMMTGLDPDQHGVQDARTAASPEVPMLAERLRAAGYRTLGLYFGDWLGPRFGFPRGFDVYREHQNAEQAEVHLAEALADQNPDRPVFLFLHLFDVHSAGFAPEFRGFYDPPPPHDTAFHDDPRGVLADVPCPPVWRGAESLDAEQEEAMIALYDGGVRYVDAWLERCIEGWRESGLLDRSVLLITADHGESLGSHGDYGTHGGMYEEGLRVPLLLRYPDGHRRGEREQGLVSVVDYVPTLLEAAGLEVEPWRAGRSLRIPPPPGRMVYAQRDDMRVLIRAGWKVVSSGGSGYAFHLEQDAREEEPVPLSSPTVHSHVQALRDAFLAERARHPRPPGEPIALDELDAGARAKLAQLGYTDEIGD